MFEQEGVEQPQEEIQQETPAEQTEAEKVTELEALEKFKFEGREWTAKDLKNSYLMHDDYTRKTQALAEERNKYTEERKYYDNLQADLEWIKSHPNDVAKFKSTYPEKFHKYLGYVQTPQEGAPQKAQIDPSIQERLDRFDRLEAEFNQKKVEAIDAELDAKFSKLSEKYAYANEESVIARAQSLLDKGEKLTDQVWDQLWKADNDRVQKLAEKYYADKVNKQKTANAQGKDVASGGGTPGTAPVVARTIKEASNLARQAMEA